jgi:hypothetical protein
VSAVDDQGGLLDPCQGRAEVLLDKRLPKLGDRRRVVARELGAGPVGGFLKILAHRLGEDRLARRRRQSGKIVAYPGPTRFDHFRRQAQIPAVLVQHPRRHVDDDGAGQTLAGRAAQDLPEHRSPERPADADRLDDPERNEQSLDILCQPLDGGRFSGGLPVAAKIYADQPEVGGQIGLRSKEAAMRHQAVEQHQRPSGTAVPIRNACAVRCPELLQNLSPAHQLSRQLRHLKLPLTES